MLVHAKWSGIRASFSNIVVAFMALFKWTVLSVPRWSLYEHFGTCCQSVISQRHVVQPVASVFVSSHFFFCWFSSDVILFRYNGKANKNFASMVSFDVWLSRFPLKYFIQHRCNSGGMWRLSRGFRGAGECARRYGGGTKFRKGNWSRTFWKVRPLQVIWGMSNTTLRLKTVGCGR